MSEPPERSNCLKHVKLNKFKGNYVTKTLNSVTKSLFLIDMLRQF